MDNKDDILDPQVLGSEQGAETGEMRMESRRWPRITRENVFLAIYSFSKRQKIFFFTLLVLFIVSSAGILYTFNTYFLTEVPADGGTFVEGVVGAPRFINPVLAVSDTDRDLSMLIYSGLMRVSKDGSLIPDLAESYSLSEDGRIYTFILKPNLTWHDGMPLTTEDVRFTIEKTKDQNIRGPRRGNWDGIVVEILDARTITFTLSESYAPFLENTTLGILPAHLWKDLTSEEFMVSSLNTHPIGSGPYRLSGEKVRDSGVPEYYDLLPFDDFALGRPHIKLIRFHFYGGESDLLLGYEKGEVDALAAISSEKGKMMEERGERVTKTPLPRVFGVFFNQSSQELFTDKAVREALDKAVDKDYIVSNVLHGQAEKALGPFPQGSSAWIAAGASALEETESSVEAADRIAAARNILLSLGWVFDEDSKQWTKKGKKGALPLAFSLATSDAPELKVVAESLKRDWTLLGVSVDIKIFEAGDLNQNVIRPRKYDALLFGEIVGRDPDPYAFWHSSERLDPGLNVALYANVKADKLLEKMRENITLEERKQLYREFQNEIIRDVPAIFLYSPQFLYVLPKEIAHIVLPPIIYPGERFAGVHEWYMETDKVWKIFAP